MKVRDGDTRYYIDLDLSKGRIINWKYGNRFQIKQVLDNPKHHRVFISEGQYNKLERRAGILPEAAQ